MQYLKQANPCKSASHPTNLAVASVVIESQLNCLQQRT
jgi:hypothetical protein